ncbi:rho-N domain-containing protein 1, chloroplastic-like [Coffea eugenioides]|uniref:rho-N domain-containing protein 1, chloroplastic-like n=1 Tax=Coffea eugenioides TaxID=49369 RepID=UPI000F5CD1D4|nr:rho-N domain-containing protein 1, chloroplastic-like [Coffea arabica]XP_027171566.1 rho-N domain-containing protein 1, chloroplastic-like [Coffea eugenioides]
MSRAIHFIAKNVPGHGPSEGAGLPYRGSNKNSAKIKHLRCTVRNTSPVCCASSGDHRRDPDFSRQKKHGFSRNRNRQNEDREGCDSLEESEMFSSKNGPLLTTSGIPRFQATAIPGPREKEIREAREARSDAPVMSRPRSNFQRRSPVHLVKTEPVFSDEDAMSSVPRDNSVQEGKKKSLEPEFGVGLDTESDTEATFSDGDEFDEMSEDEISGIYDDDNENVQELDADEY